MPVVYVIVVTYNGLRWIDKCLASLADSSFPLKTIVIDNCSTDGTPQWINENHPHATLVQMEANIGFGQANNIGLKEAIAAGVDYVFLLNQDAWIENDTIEELLVAYKNDTSLGIISPLHLNGSGACLDPLFHMYLANELARNRKITSQLFLKDGLGPSIPINFVNAAAWFIARQTIERVGGFDPLFPHWGEDNNFIDRLAPHNLSVAICPKARIFHDREEACKDRSKFYQEYYYRVNLRKLLSPEEGARFSETISQMCQDMLKALVRLKISRAHQVGNAIIKIYKNRAAIAARKKMYKMPCCFLDC